MKIFATAGHLLLLWITLIPSWGKGCIEVLGMDKSFHPALYSGCDWLNHGGIKVNPKIIYMIFACRTYRVYNPSSSNPAVYICMYVYVCACVCTYIQWIRNQQVIIMTIIHDDIFKWKHFPRYWSFVWGIHWSPVNSPHKGQWRGTLMFSLICVWINGWLNNREAGDLRRHRAHYDVIVMNNLVI